VQGGRYLRKIRHTTELPVNSRASRSRVCKFRLLALLMIICSACAISYASTSRLYPPSDDETGGLRLVQVMQLATREEILKLGEQLEHLHASGIKDSDFRDGSVARSSGPANVVSPEVSRNSLRTRDSGPSPFQSCGGLSLRPEFRM
jgi:hypothetical protein